MVKIAADKKDVDVFDLSWNFDRLFRVISMAAFKSGTSLRGRQAQYIHSFFNEPSPDTSSVTAYYYPYQLHVVFYYVKVAKNRGLQLNTAFVGRFDNYYMVEFKHDYDHLEAIIENCGNKKDPNICNEYVDIEAALTEALIGQFSSMPASHKTDHNAIIDATVNHLNLFGRMDSKK